MNAVSVTFDSKDTMNISTFVINFHKCDQCLKGHKSLSGYSLNVFVFVFLLVRSRILITLIKCFEGHKSQGSLAEGAL